MRLMGIRRITLSSFLNSWKSTFSFIQTTMVRCWTEFWNDVIFRRKLLLTCAVLFSYILQGWSEQQVGVALPSLQALIRVDKEKLSTILVVWNVGYVVGSMTSGILFDKYNRLVLMFLLTIGLAAGTAALPFCVSLTSMLVCRFFLGVFNGGSDTGSNTIIPTIWQDNCGPFEQILYVCYAVGGILSPFATIPFTNRGNELTNLNQTSAVSEKPRELYIAFLITSVMFVICAIPYILMRVSGSFNNIAGKHVQDGTMQDGQRVETHKHTYYIILICLMGAIHALAVASEDSITAYLTTFSVQILNWNKLDSAKLVSSYWISSCASGVIGILIAKYVDSTKILFVATILVNVSLCFVMLGYYFELSWLIWIGFILCGCSMILIIPTVFSWSQKYACEITGKISSIFTVCAGLSSATSACLTGVLFEKNLNTSFLFILLACAVSCLILYVLAYLLRVKSCKIVRSSRFNVECERNLGVSEQVLCVSVIQFDK